MNDNTTWAQHTIGFWIPWVLMAGFMLLGVWREKKIYDWPPILREKHYDALRDAAGTPALEARIAALERQLNGAKP